MRVLDLPALAPYPLLVLFAAGAARAGPYAITGHDTVTTPGEPVALRAKFERKLVGLWRPDIRDEDATLVGEGRHYAVRTDADGVAAARVAFDAPGVYRFRAALDRDPDQAGEARVWVLDPDRPVAVVDIDGTLSDLPGILVHLKSDDAPTFAGAPELLRDLARTHQVVYLTARDDVLDAATRAFLARHDFPPGPVLFNDMGLWSAEERRQFDPENHGEFKLGVIQALQARGVPVTLGIGNAETDASAYEGAGIASAILTDAEGEGPSFRFRDYAELRRRLEEDGVLAPATGGTTVEAAAPRLGAADRLRQELADD